MISPQKRSRWSVAWFITALGALALLTACGGDDTTPTADATPTPTSPSGSDTTPTPTDGESTPAPTAEPGGTAIPDDYFEGKTITIIVGYEAGTSSDATARVMAQFWGDFIPGNPRIQVSNMPGAHSNIAANYIWDSAPDGTTMFWGNGGTPSEQISYADQVKYDFREFKRVGTFENQVGMWLAGGWLPYDRLQDAIGGTEEFVIEAGIAAPSNIPYFMQQNLDIPMRIAYGTSSGHAQFMLNFERKDVDTSITRSAWERLPDDRPGWWAEGFLVPWAITSNHTHETYPCNAEMCMPKDVMNVREFLDDQAKFEYEVLTADDGLLRRTGFLAPETPRGIQMILVNSMEEMINDPEAREAMTQVMGREPDEFTPGPEIEEFTQQMDLETFVEVSEKYTPPQAQ